MTDTPAPYRYTLLLDDTGDIVFDGAGKLCVTTTDEEKRTQDMEIFIQTIMGEDIFNRNYGFDIVSAKTNPFSPERVEYEVRQTIGQYRNREDRPNRIKSINYVAVSDPDVDRVVSVSVNVTADTNKISSLSVNI